MVVWDVILVDSVSVDLRTLVGDFRTMLRGTCRTWSRSALPTCFSSRAGVGNRGETIVFWSEFVDFSQSHPGFDVGLKFI